MHYYKARWDEDRGDELASWGCSDWYFEVQSGDTVVRQMEVYDSGAMLQYHPQYLDDRFGMLTDQPFDPEGFPVVAITREEFEQAWSSHPPTNQQPSVT